MLRNNSFPGFLALGLSCLVASTAVGQSDIWGGGFPNDNIDVGTNWASQTVPTTYTAGTDTLVFNDDSNSNLNVSIAGISFDKIELSDPGAFSISADIYGSNPLTLGSGGIVIKGRSSNGSQISIDAPLVLYASQTWSAACNPGYFTIGGVVSGSGALTLDGGSGNSSFEFDNASNTFSGGLSVSGANTQLLVATTGTPLGTGTVQIGDGVVFSPTKSSTLSLGNAMIFGDGSNGSAVVVGRQPSTTEIHPSTLVFTGSATFNPNGSDSSYSEVDLLANTKVTFAGPVDGGSSGTTLGFGVSNSGTNSLVVIQGDIGPNITQLNALQGASVILDGASPSQIGNLSKMDDDLNAYLGFGKNYAGSIASSMSIIDPPCVEGTIGFDTTSGSTQTFSDAINLTNFSDSNFVGLGSATKAILSGTITPPGGLDHNYSVTYPFGGGGGTLTVTSTLRDSYDDDTYSNSVNLNPGNAPLTLVLSGTLTYSGGTYVNGGALIFNTALPTSGGIVLGGGSFASPGYVGSTAAAGFLDDDSGAEGTHPQDFLAKISGDGSYGVVGFDALSGSRTITGSLDLTSLPNVYLGTATAVTYAGTITPFNSTFYFSGVKGGQVTVTSPSLTGEASLVVGLPTPMESFGSVSSVILPNANAFTGSVTLNSGYLYVGDNGSLGGSEVRNSITVTGPAESGSGTVIGLAPFGANITLANDISVPTEGLHLNYAGSPYTLELTGVISDTTTNGSLIIDGPVALDNVNSLSGSVTVKGTTLTLNNDDPLDVISSLVAKPGSTVNFTTFNGYTPYLTLENAVANFTYVGGSPEVDNLSMSAGSQLNFAAGSTPYIYQMTSDEPNSGNVISLGTGAALTIDLSTDPDYHGTIVGAGSLTVLGGTLNLLGANTYSGGTTVGSTGDNQAVVIASNNSALGTGPVTVYGTLAANTGVTISNPVTLNSGASIAGFGTFAGGGTYTFGTSVSLSPGVVGLSSVSNSSIPAVGALTFTGGTNFVFAPGGYYEFGVTDANGLPGVGYGTASIDGTLTVTATPTNPFTIEVHSYAPGSNTADGLAANFDASSSYSWTLLSTGGPIANFNSQDFVVNSAGMFANSTGIGSFYVSADGDNLVLNFTPVPEPSTWALIGTGLAVLGIAWRLQRRRCAA